MEFIKNINIYKSFMRTKEFSYAVYWDSRKECVEKFGSIFELPVVKEHMVEILKSYDSGNVLDVGAGKEKPLFFAIKNSLKNGEYYSCDIDETADVNFRKLSEIPSNLKFSLVTANQLFEHLAIQESIDMFVEISKVLADNGKFIITIPNIAHPNRYFGDITHKTWWSYTGAYMLYKYANLEVTLAARYSKVAPQGIIDKFITNKISKLYRMDCADSILMIGRKCKK